MPNRWKPNVTVSAVIERDQRFLLVEEHTADGLRLNTPAGHLDPAETPVQACVREVLEETAHSFTPTALVGIYMNRFIRTRTGSDITYMRFAFTGELGMYHSHRKLDEGIVRTVWLSLEELHASAHLHPLQIAQGAEYRVLLIKTDDLGQHVVARLFLDPAQVTDTRLGQPTLQQHAIDALDAPPHRHRREGGQRLDLTLLPGLQACLQLLTHQRTS